MADVNGLGLKEPDQVDWEKLGKASNYVAPPPVKGADGRYIIYFGQLPTTITLDVDDNGFRTYLLDPIKLVKNGAGIDGRELRFTRVGLKSFSNGNNSTALLLKSVGSPTKPQKTAEYDAAVKQVAGKVASFSIDWEARNKDTGETVRGYDNFPDDPDRPGMKKSILRQGDTYMEDGVERTVQSEVLFANPRIRFFEVAKK